MVRARPSDRAGHERSPSAGSPPVGDHPSRGDQPTRVLVCGGRGYEDRHNVFRTLNQLEPKVVIHGGARGADAIAAEWAYLKGATAEAYHANWIKDGKAAGPIRNQRMLDASKPDLVVAFPGGRGTADMLRRARAAGVRILDLASAIETEGGNEVPSRSDESATRRETPE